MKIAMFTDTYEPQINGVVSSIKIFSEELRKRGHEVHIFCPDSPDFKSDDKFVHTFRSIPLAIYPEYRVGVPFFSPVFERIKFDIFHVHTPAFVGAAGIILGKYYKKPIVGHFHTLVPEYTHYLIFNEKLRKIKEIEKLTKKGTWKYLSLFYNRCDCIIAPSAAIKKILQKNHVKKNIVVIPTPYHRDIRTAFSKSSLRKKYGFGKKDRILLHVGRVTKEKNISFLIKNLKNLIKDQYVKLIICSDGPHKHILEAEVKKLGLEKNILFTGYVSEKELDELYYLSDVFVFASKTETQAIVLLDAVAHQLPIIALNAPVVSEFVLENGVGLVSNERDFSETVMKLLKERKLAAKFIKNRKNILKKYSVEKNTTEILNLYRKLIKDYAQYSG